MRSDYRVFDGHCDSVSVKNLLHTKTQLDPRDMKKYPSYIQVFAICPEAKYPPYLFTSRMIERFDRLVHKWGISKILTAEDLDNTQYGGILAIEGADAVRNVSHVDMFYKRGVRLITLTWSNDNAIANGIRAEVDNGLTGFGRKVVRRCEDLGIVIDLSHISVKSFYDVAEIATKPFVCSHSNARAVYEHKRGLSDDQFKVIAEKGGVSGINFAPYFLGEDASIKDILLHIEHFCSLGGEWNIGLGSDFDGIEYMPNGCTGAKFMNTIAEELLKNNYSEAVVKGIMYDNFYRVFKEILN